jgi:hypothetical protein
MPDDEGLPLPPPPAVHPPTIRPGANDLDTQMVRDEFKNIAQSSADQVRPWADKLQAAAGHGGRLTVPHYDPAANGLLTPPKSVLDAAMGVDTNKTGMADMLTSVGRGMGYMFKHPVSSLWDESKVDQIKAAQQQFLADYGGVLDRMSNRIRDAKSALREMAGLMATSGISRMKLQEIMDAKATCGNAEYAAILRELDDTTDPERRAELEQQKAAMEEWMRQRDARIAAEKPTVDALSNRLSALADEMARQQAVLEDAGTSVRVPGGVDHVDPRSIDFARALRDLIAGSRARLDLALAGRSG